MQAPNFVAFIPLRGGSKSIPKKNIRYLAGKPMALWAIESAVRCPEIDRVYVATDDREIAEVIATAGLQKVKIVG
ncbi:MAG: cytidylyltransferase domain-containing protein, partial [Verrucomicrobiales bacterium]